ncbi:ion channel domain-containing protein [Ditylenchus destructor]|uniref:Ion channel domain-containing protein n=1 Tax=Ditylenchus destructor TaxID=166010 RepID=A0AAD4N337_9BILA|nr:ion channel domain-containing protein [Ditylenchus destructor]
MVRNSKTDDVLLDHPLHMDLLDVNDNAPEWNQTQWKFTWHYRPGQVDGSMYVKDENHIRLVAKDSDEINTYLFDRAKYDRLYNCSVLSPAEWESKKHPNVIIDNQITIMIARKILAFILYLIVGTFVLPYFNEELDKQQSFEWLAYAFITVSTIGFGNQFPRGWTSTISTCVYAFFGNPLYNDVTAAVYEKLRDFGQRVYESGMATALINLAYQPVTALHIFQENRRLRGDMEQMQAQFAHDLRMHENENRRLRDDMEQMQAQFAHDLEQIQAQLMNEINLLNGKNSLYKTMFDLYSRRGQ